MCVNIEVILPTIERFLLLYSLRCGSFLVLFWTTIRSLFCIIFFTSAILETLIGIQSPFGAWLVSEKLETKYTYVVYYTLITLLLCETIILVFMIHLSMGLCCCKTHLLEQYLICRFSTWLVEILGLFIMCLADKILIGWYLGILFFVVLEFYSLIAIYSYYVQLMEEEKEF